MNLGKTAGPGLARFMKNRWLGGLVISGFVSSAATADVLDDVGLSEADFSVAYSVSGFGTKSRSLSGLPVSQAHAAGIAKELAKTRSPWEGAFWESMGHYAEALDQPFIAPLDRVRLLLRAGRVEEARAALAEEGIRPLADSLNPGSLLLPACRPLEDAAAWDELEAYLQLLSTRLRSPEWRLAVWAEEVDLAWHLDRVPALLEEAAADDPLRLAVFHHRLGNKEERDRLASGLLENARPERVAELFSMLPDCPPVRDAALGLWNHPVLAADVRVGLYSQMIDRKSVV